MIDHLKLSLTAAGCTLVIYENDQIANIQLDQSSSTDIIGVIIEPSVLTFETTGNGINERYPPIYVEILKQTGPEQSAETNKTILDELRRVCRAFIYVMIRSGYYKKVPNIAASKVVERKYDANVIGWSLSMNISPLQNRDNCDDSNVDLYSIISIDDFCAACSDASTAIVNAINNKF